MADFLLSGCKYLAIVMTAVVCLAIALAFGSMRTPEYLNAESYQLMGSAMLASFAIFFIGIVAAKKLK